MGETKCFFCRNCKIYFVYCVVEENFKLKNYLHCLLCSSLNPLVRIFPSENDFFLGNNRETHKKSFVIEEHDNFDVFYIISCC